MLVETEQYTFSSKIVYEDMICSIIVVVRWLKLKSLFLGDGQMTTM